MWQFLLGAMAGGTAAFIIFCLFAINGKMT